MAETAYYACDYTNYIAAWKRFLNLKPDIYEAWKNKTSALFRLGRSEEAVPSHKQTRKLKPTS